MDAGYGGPVWHASIARHGRSGRPIRIATVDPGEYLTRVARALQSVGSAALGEWTELGDVAVHLRRRLTPDEWGPRPWGMDLRRTEQGRARLAAAGLPRGFPTEEW